MLEGSLLKQLKDAHQPGQIGKRPLNFGVYYKNTLVALCHALEDSILTAGSKPLVVAAFQRGKWYLQEADHYSQLADASEQIVIMAAPEAGFSDHPTSQKPTVALVGLEPTDPVAQEWHLIILSPTYSAMVLCQELSEEDYGKQGVPAHDLERKFYGFWTFEANLVQELVELAIDHIHPYDAQLAKTLSRHLETISTTQVEQRDDLGQIVARVVDYLQVGHDDLSHQVGATQAVDLHPEILDGNLLSNEVQAFLRMAQLTDQADLINSTATVEVATLAEAMGQLLDLPAWQLNRLKLAGLLHRLSPLQQTQSVLSSAGSGRYGDDPAQAAPSCPLVPGAQVLRTMPQLRAIAAIITHQTEHWDGSGYPGSLAGDGIPLESRILGLVADFQQRAAYLKSTLAHAHAQTPEECAGQALAECQKEQGKLWDPKLVDALSLLVSGLQQGFSLAVNFPKISAGLWLIDSHCGDDLWQEH
jgi:DICT domain-containing protein